MKVKSFEDLEVWQKSKEITLRSYELTASFPKEEAFGITAQIKRASLSVSANIAEGFGRFHYPDRTKFFLNARGSLFELKSHVLIAADLKFMNQQNATQLIAPMSRPEGGRFYWLVLPARSDGDQPGSAAHSLGREASEGIRI